MFLGCAWRRHFWKKGAWLYGDYINDLDGVTTAVGCAQACVADTKCALAF